jgi:pyruvate/2-oxoglutarate dehydrogenase complex dihydrolipoamide dehydrogenase (E3) component
MAELRTPDLCIIGGGPAGIAAAMAARELGVEVVLIEAGRMGGARLGHGSIATRAFTSLANRAAAALTAARQDLGVEGAAVDYAALVAAAAGSVETLEADYSVERLEALGVEVIGGAASFTDRRRVRVGDTTVRARRFIVATGSRPAIPDFAGLAATPHFDTDTIFGLADQPSHLLVLGGSPLAIEFAQAHRRLGAAVTLIAAGPALEGVDPELAAILMRRLEAEGIRQHWAVPIETVAAAPDGGVHVAFRSEAGATARVAGSHLLVACGRAPDVDGLALDRAGVALARAGRPGVVTGRGLRTANPAIYAVGDVTGAEPSEALAVAEAEWVVRHVLFGAPIRTRLAAVPRVVFADPPIAEIGITEPEAMAAHRGRYRVHRVAYAQSDRARIEGRTAGLAKLVTDPAGRILGAGIVGVEAPELVALVAFAIESRIPAARLADFVPPYPAYAALLRDLGRQATGRLEPTPLHRALIGLFRRLP